MTQFEYVPHPRIEARKEAGPATTATVTAPQAGAPWYVRFNTALAVKITNGVGTMWCAYIFGLIALAGLPQAVHDSTAGASFHPLPLVQWVAQTFLQLVLLSIIIVGQNIQAQASDKRAEATFEDADAVLHTAVQIQEHLEAQDRALERILDEVRQARGR